MKKVSTLLPLAVAACIALAVIGVFVLSPQLARSRGLGDISNMDGVHLDGSFGTATPQLLIQNNGTSNSLEIRDSSATPVFYVDADGNATYTGFSSGGGAVAGAVHITAPTAVATATPALIINNLGAGNNILELRNDATPVASFDNAGVLDMKNNAISNIGAAGTDFSATGGLTLADDLDMSNQPVVNIGAAGTDFNGTGGLTLAAGLTVTTGPTDLGGSLNYGTDNLYPLGYASDAQQIVCGTTTITESAQITPTGLTTVTYVIASQITTPASGGAFLSVSDPATTSFVLSSWEGDYTAGTVPVAAHWCAVGDQ